MKPRPEFSLTTLPASSILFLCLFSLDVGANQQYPNQQYPNQQYPNQQYPNQQYPNQTQPPPAQPGPYPEQTYPQTQYPPPYAEPPPPPPPLPDPTANHHDGWFLRPALGLGYASIGREFAGEESTASGVMSNFEVLLGGTVTTGLVLGGGLLINVMGNPTYKSGGIEQPQAVGSFTLTTLPVFANYYTDPEQGLNFQGLLGFGFGNETIGGEGGDPTGIVLGAGLGWESWVASQWSLGFFGRFQYAHVSFEEEVLWSYDVFSTTVSFVATMH